MTSTKRVLTQVHTVVGAIVERDGNILLVQENNSEHPDHGKWNQPAGWLELGETPLEAAAREVEEETGYSFTPTALIGVYSLVKESQRENYGLAPHGVKIIFAGDISKGPVRTLANDVSNIKWFSQEEINSMDISTLRDIDIKQEVADYFTGKRYPLSVVTHTVQQ